VRAARGWRFEKLQGARKRAGGGRRQEEEIAVGLVANKYQDADIG